MGFLNDFVNGKEKKYSADPLAGDINASGKKGLALLNSGSDQLNAIYDQDPTQLINSQIGIENKALRGAADDATRRTRDLIARRGMGNSSIGLGQEINQTRDLNSKLALNNASGFSRLRETQLNNATGKMNVGNSLFAVKQNQGPIQMQDQTARTGGYGQLVASGIQAVGSAWNRK